MSVDALVQHYQCHEARNIVSCHSDVFPALRYVALSQSHVDITHRRQKTTHAETETLLCMHTPGCNSTRFNACTPVVALQCVLLCNSAKPFVLVLSLWCHRERVPVLPQSLLCCLCVLMQMSTVRQSQLPLPRVASAAARLSQESVQPLAALTAQYRASYG